MRSILSFILFSITLSVFSQDLIATTQGDSLNCKITKNEANHIYYRHIRNHRLSSDSISSDSVKSFIVGYYKQTRKSTPKPREIVINEKRQETSTQPKVISPKVITPKPTITPRQHLTSPELPHFFLSMNAGFSNRTGEIDETLDQFLIDFFKKVRRGNSWGVNLGYFINDNVGVGITYSHYFSKEILENILIEDSLGQIEVGNYTVDVSIKYTGASLLLRKVLDDKNILLGNVSLGLTTFRDKQELVSLSYLATGKDLGMSFAGSYLYMIDQNFSVGATIEYNYSLINTLDLTIDNQQFTLTEFPEDASRYNIQFLFAAWF